MIPPSIQYIANILGEKYYCWNSKSLAGNGEKDVDLIIWGQRKMNLHTTWATAFPYFLELSSQTGFPPTIMFPSHSFSPPTSFIFETEREASCKSVSLNRSVFRI